MSSGYANGGSPSADDSLVNVARRAHLAHEARAVKSLAEDALEDGIHAARRAVKSVRRGVERVEDLRDEGAHYVRRQPLTAVAAATALGLAVGLVAGWIVGRFRPTKTRSADHLL